MLCELAGAAQTETETHKHTHHKRCRFASSTRAESPLILAFWHGCTGQVDVRDGRNYLGASVFFHPCLTLAGQQVASANCSLLFPLSTCFLLPTCVCAYVRVYERESLHVSWFASLLCASCVSLLVYLCWLACSMHPCARPCCVRHVYHCFVLDVYLLVFVHVRTRTSML